MKTAMCDHSYVFENSGIVSDKIKQVEIIAFP